MEGLNPEHKDWNLGSDDNSGDEVGDKEEKK